MSRWICRSLLGAVLLLALALPPQAGAIPVYSRKYATSCVTCHTTYPHLTPFGEAFRRLGYRFPGVDSDYIKQELIQLGQEQNKKDFPNAVWPSFMTQAPIFGAGLSTRVTLHPDLGTVAAKNDNRTLVSFDRLANSAALYAHASIDDDITVLVQLGVSDTATTLDEGLVIWSDLVGPKHMADLTVGYAVPTLTPFARTTSYASPGAYLWALPMTTIFGGTGAAFRPTTKYNLAEINGSVAGRLEYGVGLAAGGHVDGVRAAENVYGHLAYKLGGMRLDGEGGYVPPDQTRPWTENAFTVFAFGYRANTRYTGSFIPTATGVAKPVFADASTTLGGGARISWLSAALDVNYLWEDHNRVTQVLDGLGRPSPANLQTASAELSYVIYPWLVPAFRLEHAILKPRGLARATYSRMLPVIGMQLRPNVKLSVSATLEHAYGRPTAGGDWSKTLTLNPASNTASMGFQLSSMAVSASYYF